MEDLPSSPTPAILVTLQDLSSRTREYFINDRDIPKNLAVSSLNNHEISPQNFNSFLNSTSQSRAKDLKKIFLPSPAAGSLNADILSSSPLQKRNVQFRRKMTFFQRRNSTRPASTLPCPLPTTKSSSHRSINPSKADRFLCKEFIKTRYLLWD